jgi:F-type H+-transporting ATPase subunit alpha
MPAIDTGRSVSRVGGDAQLPAYKSLVGPLKLFYSQFEELESFTRFGTQMDAATKSRIDRGRAIRLVMEQRQFKTVSVVHQIAIFLATIGGLLDGLDEEKNKRAQEIIALVMDTTHKKEAAAILNRKKLTDDMKEKMLSSFKVALQKERILP